MDESLQIEDPCLVKPLAIAALLDAAAADNAVVEALAAKGNPALEERDAASRAQVTAEAVLTVLEARRVPVSDAQRQEILGCRELDQLDRWLRRASLATEADEIMTDLG